MGNGANKCEWHHAPKARGGFWEFWRKLVELRTGYRTRRVDFRLLTEAFGQEMRWGWKSQNRKNVYLSPYVEEPLNSKVIKRFVHELRSRYVFFEFRDSYVLSLWTFDVRFTQPYHGYDIYIYIYIYILEKMQIIKVHKKCLSQLWQNRSTCKISKSSSRAKTVTISKIRCSILNNVTNLEFHTHNFWVNLCPHIYPLNSN